MSAKMKEPSFEEALKALEGIVARLESGEANLDESIRLFEEGMRLSGVCQKRLDEADRKIVDESLLGFLSPGRCGMPGRLREAMEYSLAAGGKRIRPVMLLSAGAAVGGDESALLPFACAVEYIHTYSLIHDDLPAMDDDEFRRGRPTCHKAFGEAAAILAGDALLTEAFRVMGESPLAARDAGRAVRAMALLARSAGAEGMAGGQVLYLAARQGDS